MATNNVKILFYLQPSKINKKGEAPLYLRVSYNMDRKNIATGYHVRPDRWDNAKAQVKGNKENAQQINGYLSQTKAKIMGLFNDMLKEGDISLEHLVDQFLGRNTVALTLMGLVELHNKDFEARIGTDYTFSTFEKYDILRKKLGLFLASRYQKKDFRLKDLSHQFMAEFDFYLKNTDKNEHNTATKYLKNLKKILNVAVINGWIEENPFAHFKATYKDVERVYLTQHELDLIRGKEFQPARLTLVKDAFLFQCYTGLAYSDMAKLTVGDVTPGIDGNKWIITRRKKTNVRASIPLLKQAEELITKYDNGSSNPDRPLFPFYSIQKFNSYLAEIADLCGIKKNISSHVGRRTFATTIALANGISLETISKILGHTTTKITAEYAVVTDLKVAQDMTMLREKIR